MESPTPGIPWQEIVDVLRRRHRLVTLIFAAGVVTAVILAFAPAPTYEATAQLLVTSERARMIVSPDPKSGSAVDRVTEQDLNSEVALLKSNGLIRAALEPYRDRIEIPPTSRLQTLIALIMSPVDFLADAYLRLHGVAPPTRFEKWVQQVAAHLRITPVKGSNLIDMAFDDGDPQWAADLVNALATNHVAQTARRNQQPDTRRFFESQRRLLSERLHQAEASLKSFYDRESIDSFPEQRSMLRARVVELESALAHSKTELAEGMARVEFLSRELREHPTTTFVPTSTSPNDPRQLIRTRVVELELQRSALLAKFAPASTNVQEIDRQIAEAKRLMADVQKTGVLGGAALNRTHEFLELNLAQTQAQLAAVRARVDDLQTHISDYQAKLERLDDFAPEHERLQQEVSAAQEGLETYRKKEEEARFSDALDESRIVNVAIVEPAQVPPAPEASKRMTIVLLGAAMSLLVGVSLAFIRDRTDPTIKCAAEARAVTGLPLLVDIGA